MESFFIAVGFLGPVLFLWAYIMLSLGAWHGGMMRPHVLNLLGALAVVVSLFAQWNLPVFVLELCWGAVSLYGIWRVKFRS